MAKAYQVHKRKILTVAGLAGFATLQYTGLNPLAGVFATPGVKNIEDRWSSGGGGNNSTPGAATPRGNSANVTGNTMSHQGIGSDKFREEIGEQKPKVSGLEF
ncbi:hypothetical protein MMC24_000937 [Lignoscripta atroalba]|nr:hypothetical protein [Lignoscripta atroalba]